MKDLVDHLSDLQIRRPWVPLAVVAVITAFFAVFTARLELRTRYDALLPEAQPSVQELRRVEARTASAQTALILLEHPDRKVLRAMGDELVLRLADLGPETVGSVEDGTQAARSFLTPRTGLFLSLAELEQLRDDVNARWDYEVAKAQGTLLDDTGPPVTVHDIEKRFGSKAGDKGGKTDDPREGYYERKDGTALVVQIRSPIPGGDLLRTGPALAKIRATVSAVQATRPDFALVRVGYAGDMPTGFIEYEHIRNDLFGVGLSGVALVLAAVMLYFMRLRAVLVMGITIIVGLIWTFGLTQIVIGHLNVATGFLVSIVAGNGINVGILYQARYFEERRNGAATSDAVRTSVRETWLPTIIAALSAAAAYISLMVTDFSAFRHFGFIAAVGMIFCWIVKTLMVPPLLVLLERRNPIASGGEGGLRGRIRRFAMGYGSLFAWIVPKAPRLLVGTGLAIAVAGVVAAVAYVRRDPMEYDLRQTDNDPYHNEELHHAWSGAIGILGAGHGGMVVLADTRQDARALEKKLKEDWDAAPPEAEKKPFDAIHSLWDMVADDQESKIPMLLEIGDKLERARHRGYLTDADWNQVKESIPPHDLRPYGLDDLPESLARPFSERDGTRGRLIVIEPRPGDDNDLRYLLRYSNSFRETHLPNGHVVRGSGRAVIFADILEAVVRDIPRAVALSLGLTILAVLVTFRRGGWHALSVLLALLVGVSAEVMFLYFANIKINFLNFAALPITFGIGVDYAINIAQRYRADGSRDILAALRTTGGAVVLCSLTTMLGYLALLGSLNRAIRSLGTIAVVGEVSCLLAAVVFLPALWLVVERQRQAVHLRERTSPEGSDAGPPLATPGNG